MMPAHFGDRPMDSRSTGWYHDVTSMVVAYLTDREMAYFPATGQPGASVSHPTLFPSESVAKQAWIGRGKIQWHHLTWEQNPTQFHIVNAIADLPILEIRLALISKGSTNLALPDRLPRSLK